MMPSASHAEAGKRRKDQQRDQAARSLRRCGLPLPFRCIATVSRLHQPALRDSDDVPGSNLLECSGDGRHQRSKRQELVARSSEHGQRNIHTSDGLLMDDAPIDGNEDVEPAFGEAKYGAVGDAGPTSLLNRNHVMAW